MPVRGSAIQRPAEPLAVVEEPAPGELGGDGIVEGCGLGSVAGDGLSDDAPDGRDEQADTAARGGAAGVGVVHTQALAGGGQACNSLMSTVSPYARVDGQRSVPRPIRKASTDLVFPGSRPENRLGSGSMAGILNAAILL